LEVKNKRGRRIAYLKDDKRREHRAFIKKGTFMTNEEFTS